MVDKKFLLGILVLALVFGMTVVGCEEEDDDYTPPQTTQPKPGDSASNPIDRVESANTNLGTMTSPASGWRLLLSSINSTGKYVNLDLSACTMTGTSFNPDASVDTGKKYIVSIILPTVATSIEAGDYSNPTFKNFSSLKSISGTNIEAIGDYSFYSSYGDTYPRNIQSVDFPEVTTIGKSAFYSCSSLKNADFPKAATIGEDAFESCSNLESISFPASAEVGFSSNVYSNPFTYCKKIIFTLTGSGSLSVIEDGKALVRNTTTLLAYPSASGNVTLSNITALDGNVFQACYDLTAISLPNVTTVGTEAFSYCTNIQDVTLPKATTIGSRAFSNCDRLQSVNLPLVTNIGSYAFSSTSIVTVTLGSAAPTTLGIGIFSGIITARTVTVKIPSGATGYTPAASPFAGTAVTVSSGTAVNWANGFRGGGWTGYAFSGTYGDSSINQNITLTISQSQ